MKKIYPLSQVSSPIEVLRKAGYTYFKDPQSGEGSFIIRLGSEFYPRFHLYVESNQDSMIFNLHLDQKKPSYGNETMHSGEYDGPTVEKEMKRLDGWIQHMNKQENQDTAEHDQDVRSHEQQKQQGQALKRWWHKLFG